MNEVKKKKKEKTRLEKRKLQGNDEQLGDHFDSILRIGDDELALRLPKTIGVQPGNDVALKLDPGKAKIWPV